MSERKVIKILSIDGGGIKGIIPATILVELERLTGKRIADMFDMIAGTSTGGILGSVLCSNKKYSAKDALNIYIKRGEDIFSRNLCERIFSFTMSLSQNKYSHSGIESVLKEYFGKETIDESKTNLLITSFDINHMEPFLFKSWKQECVGLPLKFVCRATSAAPTYFEPFHAYIQGKERTLIDGGVYLNNPAMSAYAEAYKLYGEDIDVVIVSLGTGQMSQSIPYASAKNWGKIEWIVPLIDCMFGGVSDAVDYQMNMMLGDNYYRLQTSKLNDSTQELDNVNPENLKNLKMIADKLVKSNKAVLDEIVKKIC